MVVALLALVVAVGGTGYAAVKLKKNSVKTKTIKNLAVTESKLADGAVTNPKIADKQVKHGKLGEDAVEADKIKDGAVTPSKLSDPTLTIRGWAKVASDGTVVAGRNVTDIDQNGTGNYCFDLNFTPNGAWAQLDLTVSGGSADHIGLITPLANSCPAGHQDALAITTNAALTAVDRNFFIYFN
jgi:hypothetical protein